jgi:hypothetical protein
MCVKTPKTSKDTPFWMEFWTAPSATLFQEATQAAARAWSQLETFQEM